ncbi:DUF4232 domain-containing protein (plasmid) [Streptomyces sp. NBC_00053]|uniref:DUF4232 domain-containing protein n=1 Tax=unclassified Streptomyces TaxID=2593676 RepID=UPI002254A907|nr:MULTISPECIES: DUF4232 domain-containing protein [unclassified Streptomyces]WSG56424.1 DUF4232 domain-containing protein [Streptomyces sp. NBC_01732]MCX5106329.1 DUF4232 domain-containing protein [Streptomyces sp. NBC_00439]MCX5505570.1 DUF4232 domain-containing protein [Streptomyces sp. NBC_00052]MCX5553967.1 DUF4232 domain-containing protein [Streptomyces sp. NBC_00051]WSP52797.1 DUF4232 domain-containing protein [Streptomyces sp. NBC_01243]
MRTSIRRPAVLAASAVAALSLTLTACGGEDGSKDNGAAASVSAEQGTSGSSGGGSSSNGGVGTTGSTTTGSGTTSSTTTGSGTTGSGTSTSGTVVQAGVKKKATAKAPACTVDDVKISAAKQAGLPTTHITLTATNISGHACTLLQYPLLGFGDLPQTSKNVPAVAKSKPGTPIVLNAGTPAYAAVRINNGGVDEKNHAVSSFYVNLFAADGPAEGSRTVAAPKGGIAVDDAAAKTGYWTYELRNGADEF